MWRSVLLPACLCCLACLACLASLALLVTPVQAGPNAYGTLVVHDAQLPVSGINHQAPVCGQGVIPSGCSEVDSRLDGSGPAAHMVWKVYAAFPQQCTPRLMGVSWGIHYDPSVLILTSEATRGCGYWEMNDLAWPASDTGSSVLWSTPQMAWMVPVYTFSGYAYAPTTFEVTGHPTQDGKFGDDAIPAILDPITGYGQLGFDTDGYLPCPGTPPQGACCASDGGCSFTCQGSCRDGGIWHGEWSSCEPNPCPQYSGACCNPSTGECTVLYGWQCASPSLWLGNGSLCAPQNPCAQPGACCSASDGSCALIARASCLSPLVWNGWASCDPNPCPSVGACCAYPSGTCSVTTYEQCFQYGRWLGSGTPCTPNPCPPLGACCSPGTGACDIRIESMCSSPFVWHSGWTSCSPNPCPQQGACCNLENGVCALTLQTACTDPRVWHATWTSCLPNPCPQLGACCFGENCTSLVQELCGGSWYAMSCSPNPCGQPFGACCLPATGQCLYEPQSFCTGVWQGEGIVCSPNPCPQPTGACCAPHGTCAVTTGAACVSPNSWQGSMSVCSPNPCPQPPPFGACCTYDGMSCTVTSLADCPTYYAWFGAQSCSPSPCGMWVPVEHTSWGKIKARYK